VIYNSYLSLSNRETLGEFSVLAVKAIERFDDGFLAALANLETGIQTTSLFPPNIADLLAWVKEAQIKAAMAHRDSVRGGSSGAIEPPAVDDAKAAVMKSRFEALVAELTAIPEVNHGRRTIDDSQLSPASREYMTEARKRWDNRHADRLGHPMLSPQALAVYLAPSHRTG